ncbi:hypothetical protein ACF0H5_005814 [Mactra antiquata]
MIGVLAFLYFTPIIVLRIAGWVAKYEQIIPNEEHEEYEVIGEPFEEVSFDVDHSGEWIYADGITYPLNVSDILSLQRLGLSAKYPILVGRLRRLIFVLLVPSFIIIKLFMYSQGIGMWDDGDKITVKMIVDRGLPMGFLSILGDPDQRRNVFVYCLGGPLGVICLYYALSFLFLILPRSVKQIIEDVDLSRQLNENKKVATDANGQDVEKVQEKKCCFGIPKALFDILVQEFRPAHRELLSLTFKAAIIIIFVYALLNVSSAINTGPTNEISEVMHVMFIVVVGALPRLVSSLFSHRNDIQLNEIKERQIREVITRYWRDMDREMRYELANR